MRVHTGFIATTLGICSLGLVSSTWAGELLVADADTYVSQAAPSSTFCSHPTLRVGNGYTTYITWEDIAAEIPEGSTVTDVQVQLKQAGSPNTPNTIAMAVRKVTSDWTCPSWNNRPSTAQLWNNYYTVPGLTSGTATRIFMDDPAHALRDYVQSVVNGPADSIQLAFEYGTGSGYVQFFSEDTSFVPTIVVEYAADTEPDIAVEDVWLVPANPIAGEPVDIYMRMRNIGDADAEDIEIEYFVDGNDVGGDSHGTLAPGATREEHLSNFVFPSDGVFEICVNVPPVSTEVNINNNERCEDFDIDAGPFQIVVEVQTSTGACISGAELNGLQLFLDGVQQGGTTDPAGCTHTYNGLAPGHDYEVHAYVNDMLVGKCILLNQANDTTCLIVCPVRARLDAHVLTDDLEASPGVDIALMSHAGTVWRTGRSDACGDVVWDTADGGGFTADTDVMPATQAGEYWRMRAYIDGNLVGTGMDFDDMSAGQSSDDVIVLDPNPCPADVDRNGMIEFNDVLTVLSAWGPCTSPGECPVPVDCPADVNGDGLVGFADVLIVISGWGVCP